MPPDALAELAAAWLAKAAGDIAIAEAGVAAPNVPGWAIAFHCQQAVEKSIKMHLVLAGIEPPHSHDLIFLFELARLATTEFPLGLAELKALHPFAVADRYPILTQRNIERADVLPLLKFARRAMAWADCLLPEN